MPSLPVVFTRRAARQVDSAVSWWRENSPSIPVDPRPLVVEHGEDLRGMEATTSELRWLFEARVAAGRAVVVTVTTGRGSGDLVRWLRGCADVVEVSRDVS